MGDMKLDNLLAKKYIWWWAMVPGVVLRIMMVLRSGFPINDGGMFFTIISDILKNNFQLPTLLSYNQVGIPFAYPPLAFYLAAGLNRFGGIAVLDILHYLPTVFSILTIPAFYMLALKIVGNKETAGISTLFYSIAPRSFMWLIMGGGLTRSLGMLLAILALRYLYSLYTTADKSWIWVGILCGLTLLSHPEMGLFLGLSNLVFWGFRGRNTKGIAVTLKLWLVAGGMVLPWAAIILQRHGWGVFANALAAGSAPLYTIILLLGFSLTGELGLAFVNVLGFLGTISQVIQQKMFLPIWLFLVILIDPRAAQTESMVVLALLAGWFWIKYIKGVVGSKWMLGGIVTYVFCLNIVAALSANSELGYVSKTEIKAMNWVKNNTDETSRFLVLTPRAAQFWPIDREVEWFYPLTNRAAVNTIQGFEWLGKGEFMKRTQANVQLKDRGYWMNADEVWEKYFGDYNYIYLTNSSLVKASDLAYIDKIISSIQEKGDYVEVYKDNGVEIFRRK